MSTVGALLDLLFPPACPLCRAALASGAAGPLCAACDNRLPAASAPVCVRCGLPLAGAFDAEVACARCTHRPPPYDAARAPWRYLGTARRAVREFKYRHRWRVGRRLAEDMAGCARRSWPADSHDLIVPVPAHWLRRRLRGHDPAAELAARLSALLDTPCAPRAMRRVRWTPPQARLRGLERRRNVRGAFRADPGRIAGRRVLLVDDVLTTGATASACATALKVAGARRVHVLTAARTPRWR
jgi:ComF family protein